MLQTGLAGNLQEFTVDLDALEPAAVFVARVIWQNYPDINVPLHATRATGSPSNTPS